MKSTEDNNIQEKPIFTIEDTENNASSQEILEEPVITIECDDDMEEDNATSAVVKKRSRLKAWGM